VCGAVSSHSLIGATWLNFYIPFIRRRNLFTSFLYAFGYIETHILSLGGNDDGSHLSRGAGRFLCGFGGARARLPTSDGETVMSWLYVLSGIVALGITTYLVVALLYPEKF
jgi:K+-transporting ATPase KdpF subunit